MYEFKAGGVCPKKVSGLHLLLIVYIAFKYLFNSEFSRHVHILVMFSIVKVIVLGSHIKQMSLCEHIKIRSSQQRCSVRKGVLTELSLRPSTLLKKTLTKVFSCEFCEIYKNTFFTEHLWATASERYVFHDRN